MSSLYVRSCSLRVSGLAHRVVVVPVSGTRGPHPGPRALGRIIGPRPARCAVEALLGFPGCGSVDLVVAASKHAAFILLLPLLLDDPRVRVEVVRGNGRAHSCLVEAGDDGILKTRVARHECVSDARRVRTPSQHQRHYSGPEPHHVGSPALPLFTLPSSCAPQLRISVTPGCFMDSTRT